MVGRREAEEHRALRRRFHLSSSLILLFAFANAILYSSLLPLWEGFDEPAHYAYIESLAVQKQLPIVNRAKVPQDIRASLELLPVSWLLHNSLPRSISFDDWFRLSPQERARRRAAAMQIPRKLASQTSDLSNYEAQQAPLAYCLLAPFDLVLSRLPLPLRILTLRFLAAMASSALLLYAAQLLLEALSVTGVFRLAALACIFESQMLWASIAHVGNDFLSIPLATLFLAFLARSARENSAKNVFALAAVMAAGLCTKAYFLAFVPVAFAFLLIGLWRRRLNPRTAVVPLWIVLLAVPWYIRNFLLYRSLSGTQESIAGIGFAAARRAFPHINWIASTIDLFHWGLWTGNWSFVSYSKITLDIELLLLASAIVLLFVRFRKIVPAEWWLLIACFVFYLGLIYQTCITWAATNGRSQHAEPWYVQCIFPCIWALVFLAFERSGALGRVLALVTVLVSAWIAASTYLVKLLPLYGGFSGRSTLTSIAHWWARLPVEMLSTTVLGPLALLFVSLCLFLVLLIALNARILRQLDLENLLRGVY